MTRSLTMDDRSARIAALDAGEFAAAIAGLAALLVDAVEDGASVGFGAGLTATDAAAWWHGRAPQIAVRIARTTESRVNECVNWLDGLGDRRPW